MRCAAGSIVYTTPNQRLAFSCLGISFKFRKAARHPERRSRRYLSTAAGCAPARKASSMTEVQENASSDPNTEAPTHTGREASQRESCIPHFDALWFCYSASLPYQPDDLLSACHMRQAVAFSHFHLDIKNWSARMQRSNVRVLCTSFAYWDCRSWLPVAAVLPLRQCQ